MICWLIRLSSKESLWARCCTYQEFTQPTRNIRETISRSGITDRELFMTVYGHLTSPSIKLKTQMEVSGPRTYRKWHLTIPACLDMCTTFLQDTTTSLHSASTFLKVNTSTHTSTTWSLVCLSSCTTVWWSTKTEHRAQLHRWLMMCLSICHSSRIPRKEIKKSTSRWHWLCWLHSTQWSTSSPNIIWSTPSAIATSSTPSEEADIASSETKCSELTVLLATGKGGSHENAYKAYFSF